MCKVICQYHFWDLIFGKHKQKLFFFWIGIRRCTLTFNSLESRDIDWILALSHPFYLRLFAKKCIFVFNIYRTLSNESGENTTCCSFNIRVHHLIEANSPLHQQKYTEVFEHILASIHPIDTFQSVNSIEYIGYGKSVNNLIDMHLTHRSRWYKLHTIQSSNFQATKNIVNCNKRHRQLQNVCVCVFLDRTFMIYCFLICTHSIWSQWNPIFQQLQSICICFILFMGQSVMTIINLSHRVLHFNLIKWCINIACSRCIGSMGKSGLLHSTWIYCTKFLILLIKISRGICHFLR